MLELIWVNKMALFVACLRDQHWKYNFDLVIVKRFYLIKASYLALMLVNFFALHLDLLMELSWVLLMALLIIPMVANLKV